MPCPAPTGLSLRVRSQKRITLEIWQWRFPSGCFYFSWCRLQQAYRASLTGLAYSQTLREHCSTRSLFFSWSCLSWVLLSIDRADPLIPATFVAGCKASVAAKRRLAPLEPHAGAQLSPLIASWHVCDMPTGSDNVCLWGARPENSPCTVKMTRMTRIPRCLALLNNPYRAWARKLIKLPRVFKM